MKQLIKRIWIPISVYWTIWLSMYLFLATATEELLIFVILLFVVYRLMLWLSPFIFTVLIWGTHFIRPRPKVWETIYVNLCVLAINFLCFYLQYLLMGDWY